MNHPENLSHSLTVMALDTSYRLRAVQACDGFPVGNFANDVYKLFLPRDNRPHGLMRRSIIDMMPWKQCANIDHENRIVTILSQGNAVSVDAQLAFDEIINRAIDTNAFEMLHQTHSEDSRIIGANGFVTVERFSRSLFGLTSRGAHMTAYVKSPDGLKIWVPRRAYHSFTYPGILVFVSIT
jgi:hypothetical protein